MMSLTGKTRVLRTWTITISTWIPFRKMNARRNLDLERQKSFANSTQLYLCKLNGSIRLKRFTYPCRLRIWYRDLGDLSLSWALFYLKVVTICTTLMRIFYLTLIKLGYNQINFRHSLMQYIKKETYWIIAGGLLIELWDLFVDLVKINVKSWWKIMVSCFISIYYVYLLTVCAC